MNTETQNQITTAKDFFLYAGWMVTLYSTIISFLTFAFNVINLAYPKIDQWYGTEQSISGITMSISVLLVMFPLFIILSKTIYKDIDAVPSKKDMWVRRWALYLTIFALGLTLAITTITLVYTYLSGEAATGFLLKILVIAILSGFSIVFFIKDSKAVFIGKKTLRKKISYVVITIVLSSVIAGIIVVGSPAERRLASLDETRISDLSRIQSEVLEYWRTQEVLPEGLGDLEDSLSYVEIPLDPVTNDQYEYSQNGELSFTLCANFKTSNIDDSQNDGAMRSVRYDKYEMGWGTSTSSWEHKAERTCFERTIDPKRFPTYDN